MNVHMVNALYFCGINYNFSSFVSTFVSLRSFFLGKSSLQCVSFIYFFQE